MQRKRPLPLQEAVALIARGPLASAPTIVERDPYLPPIPSGVAASDPPLGHDFVIKHRLSSVTALQHTDDVMARMHPGFAWAWEVDASRGFGVCRGCRERRIKQ